MMALGAITRTPGAEALLPGGANVAQDMFLAEAPVLTEGVEALSGEDQPGVLSLSKRLNCLTIAPIVPWDHEGSL